MAESLLDWILDLLRNSDERNAFQADPDRYAAEHGFAAVNAGDVHDALCVAADSASAHSDHRHSEHHVAPPHHYSHHTNPVHYLHQYVTNNYTTIEEHTTNIDDSIHQNVDTHGGDFNQVIDNDPVVASGDGAVAAGGDIRDSTVTPGSGNVVGDDNHAITGDDNSTAFGSGDATTASFDHVRTGSGSGLTLTGDATGHDTDNNTATQVHASGSGPTSVDAAGPHANASQYADQADHNNSTHSNYSDHSDTSLHNTYDSNNSGHYADSHDTDYHHV
jgi:hypothetical protein